MQEIAPGCLRSERTMDPEFRRTIGRVIFNFELVCLKEAGALVSDGRLETVVEGPPVVNSMRFALLAASHESGDTFSHLWKIVQHPYIVSREDQIDRRGFGP